MGPLRHMASSRRLTLVNWFHRFGHARLTIYRGEELTDSEYGKLANHTMDTMHDSLEELVEGEDGAEGRWEVEYSVSFFHLHGRP